jgi:predicted ArsR family transcriptional regulator
LSVFVAQVPDSRRAILEFLKRNGTASIAQLAAELALTGEGVRQHLLQLQREGYIEAKAKSASDRPRTGRPATYYQLTVAGDHLFNKRYDVLAIAVMDAIGEEFGSDAAKRVFARVTDTLVHHDQTKVEGLPLEKRVEAVKDWYGAGDPYMDLETSEDGFLLIERNCPFLNVAMQRPVLCAVSVNSLTRLIGARVVREESFQRGFGRCVFRVYTNEPVEPDAWQFKLEGE